MYCFDYDRRVYLPIITRVQTFKTLVAVTSSQVRVEMNRRPCIITKLTEGVESLLK